VYEQLVITVHIQLSTADTSAGHHGESVFYGPNWLPKANETFDLKT